jgi:protein involved in polysaccharide export with SLBB domain
MNVTLHRIVRSGALALAAALALSSATVTAQTTPPVTAPASLPTSPTSALGTLTQLLGGSAPATQATPAATTQPVTVPAAPSSLIPTTPVLPLPVVPTLTGAPVVFGSQLFSGRFSSLSLSGFNGDYQVMAGDRLLVRMWGAITYEAYQNVDAQGNIFVPNVGPIHVQGIRNSDLNRQIEEQVKRTFRANVGIYATLDSAQPVKVFVTGFVRAPGFYAGLSSDSVLNFLDKAAGVDTERGSYQKIEVSRAGKLRATVNLYDFLLHGKLESVQFQDGDVISVQPRKYAVTVNGEAQNPYIFELAKPAISAAELLTLAVPTALATHIGVVRNTGVQLKSEYFPLSESAKVTVNAGDLVTLTADKYPTTILVRINGAQLGERSIVMANGARLKDLMTRLNPSPTANLEGMQLFRRSVQARQKVTLDISLRKLEAAALTARSAVAEEAALRQVESNMMMNFIERARQVVPLGQVVLTGREQANEMALEDGDVINIPERSSLVLVSGEVLFPNALMFNPRAASLDDYVTMAGGYTQKADTSKLLVMRVDGSIAPPGEMPTPGDEIMVLPKIDSKNIEVARGLTQIIYQIAIAAKVAFGL